MNKFEQLIEYVINDEDQKAQDLFHEIVVEKSREIYENLMSQDDQVDDFINDVEVEEKGARFEDDEEMDEPAMGGMDDEMGDEMGGDEMGDMGEPADEEELEDRVVDLEDKLDELMAEFEELMGDDEGMGDEMGMDDEMGGMDMGEPEMEESVFEDEDLEESDDEEVTEDEEEITEEDSEDLDEAVTLQKVTKGVAGTTEGESVGSGNEAVAVNKKTINRDNAGKGGMGGEAKPHQTVGEENGRPAPDAKDLIGKVGNTPGQSKAQKPSSAPKPKTGEEAGTNDKSINL